MSETILPTENSIASQVFEGGGTPNASMYRSNVMQSDITSLGITSRRGENDKQKGIRGILSKGLRGLQRELSAPILNFSTIEDAQSNN